jgi:protease I
VKALVLLAEGFEDLEFFCPYYRLIEEGVAVTVASPFGHSVRGRHGHAVDADMPIREANPTEYDLLLIPGGDAPEVLRLREDAVDVARTLNDEGLRIAALGHAPQLLLSAGSLSGRTLTSAASIRDDVRAAGATYRDEAIVLDANLLTGRGATDLAEFNAQLVAFLSLRV